MSREADAPEGALDILQVVEPGVDGVFNCVQTLTHALMAQGHRVSLAYSDRRAGPRLQGLVDQVSAAGGRVLNLKVGNAPAPGDLRAFLGLRALATALRPQVIHGHSSKAGALTRMLSLSGVRSRYFYSPHAYYGLSGRKGPNAFLFNLIERVFGRIGHSFASSSGERAFGEKVLGIDPRRITLVYNPIDASRFRPTEDLAAGKARFGIPASRLVLGTVGRLSPQKDPATLYRAIAPVLREVPSLHLLHVGQGELDAEMVALATELGIAERITRVPYLNQPAEAYAAMDALIMSSRYEGLSLVLLEAMACNLPLVLTKVEGVADIQPEQLSHIWTANPGDVAELSRAISAWVADEKLERPVNHREAAIARFGVEAWVGRMLEKYRTGR